MFDFSATHSTAITVLDGSPSPALLTAMIRYSSSTPRAWATNVTSLMTAVATSDHGPSDKFQLVIIEIDGVLVKKYYLLVISGQIFTSDPHF